MAQVKLLKIAADGLPLEFDSTNDDVTLKSFTVVGGGPALSATGLAMANTDVTGVQDIAFQDPTTGTINQTAGALVVDNLMAKERENTMTTAGGIAFPVITDVAGQVDSFRLPALAGIPSAAPTNGGSGHLVFDSTNGDAYVYSGSAWDNLNTTKSVENSFTAAEILTARDVVYISAADNVSKAKADAAATSYVVGLAVANASATAAVLVRENGTLGGFTGLTPGAKQYLSAATAGALTETIPAGSGNTITQVGLAKSATVLKIQILQLGRRA